MKLSHLYFINHNSGLGILIVDIGTLDCCHTSWPLVSNVVADLSPLTLMRTYSTPFPYKLRLQFSFFF